MTNTDLQQFGGNITPMEMYDALSAAQAYFNNTNKIPNIMPTLNFLRYVVKRDFDLEEQLKDRYNRSKQCQNL
jgi:hypothetical protein